MNKLSLVLLFTLLLFAAVYVVESDSYRPKRHCRKKCVLHKYVRVKCLKHKVVGRKRFSNKYTIVGKGHHLKHKKFFKCDKNSKPFLSCVSNTNLESSVPNIKLERFALPLNLVNVGKKVCKKFSRKKVCARRKKFYKRRKIIIFKKNRKFRKFRKNRKFRKHRKFDFYNKE